jgi:hypothetical protein
MSLAAGHGIECCEVCGAIEEISPEVEALKILARYVNPDRLLPPYLYDKIKKHLK